VAVRSVGLVNSRSLSLPLSSGRCASTPGVATPAGVPRPRRRAHPSRCVRACPPTPPPAAARPVRHAATRSLGRAVGASRARRGRVRRGRAAAPRRRRRRRRGRWRGGRGRRRRERRRRGGLRDVRGEERRATSGSCRFTQLRGAVSSRRRTSGTTSSTRSDMSHKGLVS
jgi:hypothetical protein